MNSTHKQSFRW